MKIKFIIPFFFAVTLHALADGPVVQSTPYSRGLLRSANSSQAQTALGFTGNDTSSVTMLSVSNWAQGAQAPFTNTMQFAFVASTNSNYGTYDIRQFGARLDGQIANNCSITAGTITLTTSQAQWAAGDVGKVISVVNAGTNGNMVFTTGISNYISSTQIGLSNAAISTVSGMFAVYGHDDSAAWQTAVNAIAPIGGTLYQPVNLLTGYSISIIATNVQDVGDWRSHYNAQIYAPTVPVIVAHCPVLTFMGAAPQIGGTVSGENFQRAPHGSIIWSTLPWGVNGTNVQNCFNFSAETGGTLNSFTQHIYGWNNLCVNVVNMSIVGSINNNMRLLNCAGCPTFNASGSEFSGSTFNQFSIDTEPVPSNTNTAGVCLPQVFNDNRIPMTDCEANYFYTAIFAGENMDLDNLRIFGVTNCFDGLNAGGNLMRIRGNCCFAGIANVFQDFPLACMMEADGINIQPSQGWTNIVLLNDPAGDFFGHIHFGLSATPILGSNQCTVIGGGNCNITGYSTTGNPATQVPEMQSGSFYVNGTLNGGFPGPGQQRLFLFRFDNASDAGNSRSSFASVAVNGANNSTLTLGGSAGEGGMLYGVNSIAFEESSSDTSVANEVGSLDNAGDLTLFQTGNFVTPGYGNFGNDLQVNGGTQNLIANNFGYAAKIVGANSGHVLILDDGGNSQLDMQFHNSTLGAMHSIEDIETTTGIRGVNGFIGPLMGQYAWVIQPDIGGAGSPDSLAIVTNGAVWFGAGIASYATNSVTFSSTAVQNTTAVNIRVIISAGGSLVLTNANSGFAVRLPGNGMYILQPNESIWGTSLTATNIAF